MNWQPIETAPRNGAMVDLWARTGRRWVDCRYQDGAWKVWDSDLGEWSPIHYEVTHWMLRPEPPR